MLVKPDIGGRDVGWMVLDTGASANFIDPAVADKLGLGAYSRFRVTTVAGLVPSRYRVAAALQLGPLIIEGCALPPANVRQRAPVVVVRTGADVRVLHGLHDAVPPRAGCAVSAASLPQRVPCLASYS